MKLDSGVPTCERCESPNVYCLQVVKDGTPHWHVTACQDCDWPHADNRANTEDRGPVQEWREKQ